MVNKNLPDFIIAGAPKSGTSSLIRYLNQLPDCSCITELDNGSEPEFFSRNYEKGLAWYKNLFNNMPENNIYGEKSVSYMIHSKAPSRIYYYLPSVKLIFLLRNPINRAFSQYKANYQRGTEFFSFKNAIKQENFRKILFKNNYSYIERGKYIEHLNKFFKYFSRDQMYFLLYEDFVQNPMEEMKKLCDFLNLNKNGLSSIVFKNISNKSLLPISNIIQLPITIYKKKLRVKMKNTMIDNIIMNIENRNLSKGNFKKPDNKLRQQLLRYYLPYNKNLEKMTDLDLSNWNK